MREKVTCVFPKVRFLNRFCRDRKMSVYSPASKNKKRFSSLVYIARQMIVVFFFFPEIPCTKNNTETKRRRSIGQRSSSQKQRALVIPGINCLSTDDRMLRFGLQRIFFFLSFEKTSRPVVFGALAGKKAGCLLGAPTCRRPAPSALPWPAPSRSAPPRPPRHCASPRPAPLRSARGVSRFRIRQVGLHMISFVRAFEKAFRTASCLRCLGR